MKRQQSNGTWITFDGDDGDKLYFCDPAKNIRCSKTGCRTTCFHTMNEEFGLFTPEKPKLSDIYTEEEIVSRILKRTDSPCIECPRGKTCMCGTTCETFQKWFNEKFNNVEKAIQITTDFNRYDD